MTRMLQQLNSTQISPDTLVAIVIAAIGALSTLVGFWITRRKTKAQTRHEDADTASLYQQIADRAAEKALKLEERVFRLENEIQRKDQRIEELENENARLRFEVATLRLEVESLRQENRKMTERFNQQSSDAKPASKDTP